jgi:hypothetical protein
MKHCPFCAEEIPHATVTCPHCGRSVAATPSPTDSPETTVAPELVLSGRQGKTLTVMGDLIRIEKQGLLTGKREKTILIRNITSVEVKKPGGFVGFIQFSIAGGKARDSSYTLTGGAIDAVKDENSVVFNGSEKYEVALKVKAYVEAWSISQPQTQSQPVAVSAADEFRKLMALTD